MASPWIDYPCSSLPFFPAATFPLKVIQSINACAATSWKPHESQINYNRLLGLLMKKPTIEIILSALPMLTFPTAAAGRYTRRKDDLSPDSPAFITSSHSMSRHRPHLLCPPGHKCPRNRPDLAHEVNPDVSFAYHEALHGSHLRRPAFKSIAVGFSVECREHGRYHRWGRGKADRCGIDDGIQWEEVEWPSWHERGYWVRNSGNWGPSRQSVSDGFEWEVGILVDWWQLIGKRDWWS